MWTDVHDGYSAASLPHSDAREERSKKSTCPHRDVDTLLIAPQLQTACS